MKKDKIIIYVLLIILNCILFFDLFVSKIFLNKYIFAFSLIVYFCIAKKYVGFKKVNNKNTKKVIGVFILLTIIYILLLYIIGIFVGFYKNSTPFSFYNLFARILPLLMVIIFSEFIRTIIVQKENIKYNFLILIALVIIDIILNISMYRSFVLDEILSLLGFVILSSISTNLLGNYITKRYGCIPNIIYKALISIYIYIFTILPNIYIFLQILFKIIFPYILYLIIDFTFVDEFKVTKKHKNINAISVIVVFGILIFFILLISCKFKYGVLVIASSSMSTQINKGDIVFFEKYEDQELELQDIIIYLENNRLIVHRIEDIQYLNNRKIYYTKGDNNQQQDEGYRIDSDIKGIVKFRVMYVGWPTIWVNQLFN